MRIFQRIIGIASVAVLLWLGWTHFFPNEEKRVHKMLDHLAAVASIPENSGAVNTMMALDALRGCFAPNVEVTVDGPVEGHHQFSDREELLQAMGVFRTRMKSVQVEFLDVEVQVDPGKQSATAELSAKAGQKGQKDIFFSEFRLQLAKQDGDWRITRVETVKATK